LKSEKLNTKYAEITEDHLKAGCKYSPHPGRNLARCR